MNRPLQHESRGPHAPQRPDRAPVAQPCITKVADLAPLQDLPSLRNMRGMPKASLQTLNAYRSPKGRGKHPLPSCQPRSLSAPLGEPEPEGIQAVLSAVGVELRGGGRRIEFELWQWRRRKGYRLRVVWALRSSRQGRALPRRLVSLVGEEGELKPTSYAGGRRRDKQGSAVTSASHAYFGPPGPRRYATGAAHRPGDFRQEYGLGR